MRFLIGALIIVAILVGAKELHSYWEQVRRRAQAEQGTEQADPAPGTPTGAQLPGLPPHLEPSLEAARRQGADGLRAWLKLNRNKVRDPRLAAIELDYVVMVGGKNFGEARETLATVKSRTPTNSPLSGRIRKLEKTYR